MRRLQPAFPATLYNLTAWASHLADKHTHVRTIKAYLTGLRSAHVDMGYEDLDIFSSLQLQRCIAGIRRLRGEADTKERRPITRDILLQILTSFDKTILLGVTLYTSFYLVFAGFLRIGEFI